MKKLILFIMLFTTVIFGAGALDVGMGLQYSNAPDQLSPGAIETYINENFYLMIHLDLMLFDNLTLNADTSGTIYKSHFNTAQHNFFYDFDLYGNLTLFEIGLASIYYFAGAGMEGSNWLDGSGNDNQYRVYMITGAGVEFQMTEKMAFNTLIKFPIYLGEIQGVAIPNPEIYFPKISLYIDYGL